jgi:hypothetical protein
LFTASWKACGPYNHPGCEINWIDGITGVCFHCRVQHYSGRQYGSYAVVTDPEFKNLVVGTAQGAIQVLTTLKAGPKKNDDIDTMFTAAMIRSGSISAAMDGGLIR